MNHKAVSQETIMVWITDGSPVCFSDTHKLDTKAPAILLFFKEEYEGVVDPDVFIGTGTIPWQRGGHDAELEWVLIFPEPITEIDISEETECVLQGMIEGKNLHLLLGEKQISWQPASVGNNVVATLDSTGKELTGGVAVRIEQLAENTVLATMHLSFEKENGVLLPERVVDSTVLKKIPVVKFLQELAGKAKDFGLTDCKLINLGANGRQSGYVMNGAYKQDAIWRELTGEPLKGLKGITDRVRHRLIEDLIKEREGMGKGSEANLLVFDRTGSSIGEAILKAE